MWSAMERVNSATGMWLAARPVQRAGGRRSPRVCRSGKYPRWHSTVRQVDARAAIHSIRRPREGRESAGVIQRELSGSGCAVLPPRPGQAPTGTGSVAALLLDC